MTITFKNTGSWRVKLPLYASSAKVVAIKNGNTGTITRLTTASTIACISFKSFSTVTAFVQITEIPAKIASSRAVITGMIGWIFNANGVAGTSSSAAACDGICKNGISI